MTAINNLKPYYWFISPVDGRSYQFTSLRATKNASKKQGALLKVWKYEPGKGSHVIYETC